MKICQNEGRPNHCRKNLLMPLGIMVLGLVALFAVQAGAVVSEEQEFDHLRTGFPLDGVHRNVDCGRCHAKGTFRELRPNAFSVIPSAGWSMPRRNRPITSRQQRHVISATRSGNGQGFGLIMPPTGPERAGPAITMSLWRW
jgi:hypothetical protein